MNGKATERKPRLSVQQISFCLLHMLRCPELFEYAKQALKPESFDPLSENAYALVWATALTVAEKNGGNLPSVALESILGAELLTKIEQYGKSLTPEDAQSANNLLAWILTMPADQLNLEFHRPLVKELVVERTVVSALAKELSDSLQFGRSVNLIDRVNEYALKAQSLLVDNRSVGASAFPDKPKTKKLQKVSTGLSWLDRYMNGGQAPGETYTLLGPSGLGKTALGVMLCVDTATVWYNMVTKNIVEKPKVSCFFSWEQDLERIQQRFWTYSAKIDSTSLEKYLGEEEELSKIGNLKDYEKLEYKAQIEEMGIEKVPGEFERFAAAKKKLERTTHIFDFSGTEDASIGAGGIDEVAAALRHLTQTLGLEIGIVVLDYAGLAIRRMISHNGLKMENMRHYLSDWVNQTRFKIALPFNCPVWSLHQLNTAANQKVPTAEQHHSSSAECGNFSENAWFAFVFSTKDKTNNLCRLFCTKERRARGDVPPVILRIEGNFGRLIDDSANWSVDPSLRRFVHNDMKDRVANMQEFHERRRKTRPGQSDLVEWAG